MPMWVEVDALSGQPNPGWFLSPDEQEELEGRLESLDIRGVGARPPALGYRGLIVRNGEGASGGQPVAIVGNKVVRLLRGGRQGVYEDSEEIESWLAATAAVHGYGALLGSAVNTVAATESEHPETSTALLETPLAFEGSPVAEFLRSLDAAWESPQARDAVIERYNEFSTLMQAALESSRAAGDAAEQFARYEQAVRDAFGNREAQQRLEQAFRDYVTHVKNLWTELDPTIVRPDEIVTMAEGLTWVAEVVATVDRVKT